MTAAAGPANTTMISDLVRQRLATALAWKGDIAAALTRAADVLTGSQRRELMRLSERVEAIEHAEQVLHDAKLLELFVPVVTAQSVLAQADDQTRQSEVERRVFEVLQRQARPARAKQERWAVLLYPLLIMLLSLLVFGFIAIEIVPLFERMFDEFGLTAPTATRLVFAISQLMHATWFWALLIGLLLVTTLLLAIRALNSLRGFVSGTADPWFSTGYSTRRSLGDLAWHTALLLEIGQELESSLAIAGAASRKAAIRRHAPHLPRQFAVAAPAADSQPNPLVAHQPYAAANWYRGVPCHLLTHALHSRHGDVERSAMLREVANLYWDREHNQSLWVLSWLQPLAVLMISTAVGFVVLALFMPLVELINGLT